MSQAGDILHVLGCRDNGVWLGELHGHTGTFQPSHVEVLSGEELPWQPLLKLRTHRRRSKPRTVEELLSRLSLQV